MANTRSSKINQEKRKNPRWGVVVTQQIVRVKECGVQSEKKKKAPYHYFALSPTPINSTSYLNMPKAAAEMPLTLTNLTDARRDEAGAHENGSEDEFPGTKTFASTLSSLPQSRVSGET